MKWKIFMFLAGLIIGAGCSMSNANPGISRPVSVAADGRLGGCFVLMSNGDIYKLYHGSRTWYGNAYMDKN